jgi:hypothetical protein
VTSNITLVRVPIGGGAAVTVFTNSIGSYPAIGTPDPAGQDLSLKGLAVDATRVYWSTPALVFAPAPSNPICDGGSIYSMPLAGGTPTAISTDNTVSPNAPSRLVSDGTNLFGWRDYNAYPASIPPSNCVSCCNSFDVVRVPVQGGFPTSVDTWNGLPNLPLSMPTTDTAADGAHFYWIDTWGTGRDVTRDGCTMCKILGPDYNCPLVDLPATRIAVDASYLYVFANGTIYRTLK